jgi:enterochelin esterase-like enzyme
MAALAVAGPVFGDMVNYTPDMHMRDGSVAVPGLVGAAGNGAGYVPAGKGVGAAWGSVPTGPVRLPSVTTSNGAIAMVAPWLAWRPTGSGKVIRTAFPAPWVDGTSTTANVMVVEPPEYDASPGRRYPVVYEAPNPAGGWAPQIDSFFTTGEAPAELMVYIQSGGGPFADSECVNSADGREQFERFVVQTVVPWVDAQFRTIASPAARTIEGGSQGGFCAPMLLLRHPDVFGQGIALSGYYTAGIRSAQTVNAALPFGGNTALMQAYSPADIAPKLAPAIRSRIYLVLAGLPSQPFFGQQLQSFAAELDRVGIAHSVIDDDLGHTWIGFERDLPIALRLVGLRQTSLGLFRG